VNKWLALIAVIRKGSQVADPATWKERQVLANALAGLLVAAFAGARAMGWVVPGVDDALLVEVGSSLAVILFALFNAITTVATTKKIGLDPVAPPSGLRESSGPPTPGSVPPDPKRVQGDAPKRDTNPFLGDN